LLNLLPIAFVISLLLLLSQDTATGLVSLALALLVRNLLVDLSHQVVEDLGHVHLELGRCLKERAVELTGQRLALVFAHHTLILYKTKISFNLISKHD
jgi:hypothetical protein